MYAQTKQTRTNTNTHTLTSEGEVEAAKPVTSERVSSALQHHRTWSVHFYHLLEILHNIQHYDLYNAVQQGEWLNILYTHAPVEILHIFSITIYIMQCSKVNGRTYYYCNTLYILMHLLRYYTLSNRKNK